MKKCLATVLCLFVIQFSFSQITEIRLSGKVVDDKSGEGIPFGYVKLHQLPVGTVTKNDGSFAVLIPQKYLKEKLEFSYVGYKTQIIPLDDLNDSRELVIRMVEDVQLLNEVVVTAPRKQENPKSILKKAIKAIDENYINTDFGLEGYYRETVKENGAHIIFADAVVVNRLKPYKKEKYHRWKDYAPSWINLTTTLSSFSYNGGTRLHRYHFHNRTLKEEYSKLIDARASDNLSTTHLNASIEGGPMGMMGKDRVKFQKYFMDDFGDYEYELGERFIEEDDRWEYVISFIPKIDEEKILKLKKKNKLWVRSHLLLAGKIFIDENTYAITGMEYSVPPHYKQYICGFDGWNIKHFDYKIKSNYKQHNGKYYLDYLRQEDEFIVEDTARNVIIPYAAVSEWRTSQVIEAPEISKEEAFHNSDANRLFDYPLEYNDDFWLEYATKNKAAVIEASVRSDMEIKRPLEVQFASKNLRDTTVQPPVARKIPSANQLHGIEWVDDYAWLKKPLNPKSDQEIMDYLKAENDYADNYFAPLRRDQRNIFQELTSWIDRNFESLPDRIDDYLYFYRYGRDDEHPTYFRKKKDSDKEQLLLDVNKMADGKEFFAAGGIQPSPTHRLFSYYENTDGSDRNTVKFKKSDSGDYLPDSLVNVTSLVWLDDQTLLYTAPEKKTLRSYQVYKHHLLQSQAEDELIYEESDKRFSISLDLSKSKEFVFLSVSSTNTSEFYFHRLGQGKVNFKLMHPREEGLRYNARHYGNQFFIGTNEGKAINNKIMVADTSKFEKKYWKEFIKHDKEVLVRDFEIFDKYIVVQEKRNALNYLRVIEKSSGKSHDVKFDEEIGYPVVTSNPYFNTDSLRLYFSSYKSVPTYYDYHMGTRKMTLLKKMNKTNLLGSKYIKVERLYAKAQDGTAIPITVMYMKWQLKLKNSKKRLFITSYGSYGSGQDPYHSNNWFPLLQRGFIIAFAHVRGGDDMGMEWYEDGKMLNKKNTFTDFIDCTEFLIEEGYADRGQIVAQGGSAGGLLMGAIANMRPDLYKIIILDVPFVDVVNTMLDDKLPLTTAEYEEWGNPNDKKYFRYIQSYSPYDNVKQQAYPNMLFLTALNDTRVGYWEPAKMVAKLREYNTSDNQILLKTDFNAGHGGASGRFEGFRDLAYKYALIFDFFKEDKATASSSSSP